MRVDVRRRSSKCVDVSAPDIYGCRYEAWITKNSCGCPSDRQTPRVPDEDVQLLVDRRLPSLNRRQHALQRNPFLHPPAGIVFVLPPSSLVGACITSESISSRCRRITIGRRAETKTSAVRTSQPRIYNLRVCGSVANVSRWLIPGLWSSSRERS